MHVLGNCLQGPLGRIAQVIIKSTVVQVCCVENYVTDSIKPVYCDLNNSKKQICVIRAMSMVIIVLHVVFAGVKKRSGGLRGLVQMRMCA